jgi:hypothetical protein
LRGLTPKAVYTESNSSLLPTGAGSVISLNNSLVLITFQCDGNWPSHFWLKSEYEGYDFTLFIIQ